MSMIKWATEGSAWLHSEKDPRWDYSTNCFCGGFIMPPEIETKIKEFEKKYGKNQMT